MVILLIFAAASIVSSIFVVSALMLSSRVSRQEPWEEPYEILEMEAEISLHPVSQTSH